MQLSRLFVFKISFIFWNLTIFKDSMRKFQRKIQKNVGMYQFICIWIRNDFKCKNDISFAHMQLRLIFWANKCNRVHKTKGQDLFCDFIICRSLEQRHFHEWPKLWRENVFRKSVPHALEGFEVMLPKHCQRVLVHIKI